MDATMKVRIRPYKGKYCSRRAANRVNDFFANITAPDDEKLKIEADEFKKIILERRKASDRMM